MIKVLFLLGLLIFSADAFGQQGQAVQQSGTVRPGNGVKWFTNRVIGDSGGPAVVPSNVNGTFICPTVTITNGVVTAASTSAVCQTSVGILVGGDTTSCILVGGDTTSCILGN